MRVIAGSARGITLKGPPDAGTRATADKVRGAIFNVLAALVPGARVLDLYAGTGALGLEALSRGAEHCDFVERRHALCAIIRENLAKSRLSELGRVLQAEVPHILSTFQEPFDIVLADPPYGDVESLALVSMPSLHRLLGVNAVVVLEHSPRVEVAGNVGPLRFVRTRRYGDSAVSIWQHDREEVVP
jgi:16S rRNA (guanine(966)-N(2))-methyltransferase RsmD